MFISNHCIKVLWMFFTLIVGFEIMLQFIAYCNIIIPIIILRKALTDKVYKQHELSAYADHYMKWLTSSLTLCHSSCSRMEFYFYKHFCCGRNNLAVSNHSVQSQQTTGLPT